MADIGYGVLALWFLFDTKNRVRTTFLWERLIVRETLIVGFFSLLGKLPLIVLHTIGAVLGLLVFALSKKHRSKVVNFMAHGWPEQPVPRRAYWRVALELGKQMLEAFKIWLQPEWVCQHTTVHGWAALEAARARAQNVIVLAPHIGAFEACARIISNRVPMASLIRPPTKDWLRHLLTHMREQTTTLKTFPMTTAGMRSIIKALDSDYVVSIMPDHVPKQGKGGVWAKFFDREAWTSTLPVKLLSRNKNVEAFTIYCLRKPWGRGFEMHITPLTYCFADMDEITGCTLVNKAMTDIIQRCPEQYQWSYNRYRVSRDVPPPPSASLSQ